MTDKHSALKRGALIGLLAGAAVAFVLLALGKFSVGEPMEAVLYIAWPLSLPTGLLFGALGLGNLASTWIPFITLALPSNGAFLGALAGWSRDRLRDRKSRPSV